MNDSNTPRPGEVRVDGAIVEKVLTDAEVRAFREGSEMPVDRLGAHLRPLVDDTTKSFVRVLQTPAAPVTPCAEKDDDASETGSECLS